MQWARARVSRLANLGCLVLYLSWLGLVGLKGADGRHRGGEWRNLKLVVNKLKPFKRRSYYHFLLQFVTLGYVGLMFYRGSAEGDVVSERERSSGFEVCCRISARYETLSYHFDLHDMV